MILGLVALATFIVMAMLARALVRTPLWWLPGAGLLAGGVIELGHLWTPLVAHAFDTTSDSGSDNDAVMFVISVCAVAYGICFLIAGGIAQRENMANVLE